MPSGQASKNGGFTITEVTIVIAVAGIILLMVLLAIPAFQRDSRNNRRRHDVQAILEAVSQYELNHSGSLPTTGVLRNYIKKYSDLSYYPYSDVSILVRAQAKNYAAGLQNGTIAGDKVALYNYQKCLAKPHGFNSSSNVGAGFNDVVALYAIDTGGARAAACQDI